MEIKLPDSNLAAIPFKVVPLGSYAPIPAPLPILECPLEILFFKRVEHLLRFALDLLHRPKTATLHFQFHFGKQKEVAGSQIW